MEQLTLELPRMWADHHVLAVRKLLAGLGVAEVEASAARKRVRLSFDPSLVQRDKVICALTEAGYAPSEVAEFAQPLANTAPGSTWYARDIRVTQTNRLDLEMSGDFRKY